MPIAPAAAINANTSGNSLREATEKPALELKRINMVDQLALTLAAMDYDVVVTIGHTDSVGSDASNQKLGEQRAAAVHSCPVGKGIDASRIKSEGKGEQEPIASNATAQGRAQNRRVEIEACGSAENAKNPLHRSTAGANPLPMRRQAPCLSRRATMRVHRANAISALIQA